jgi:hypothetical protein
MYLLVESGTLYILIGVSSNLGNYCKHELIMIINFFSRQASILATTLIRVPFGTVGDIATPVGVQLAVRTPLTLLRSPTNCVDLVILALREFIQSSCS